MKHKPPRSLLALALLWGCFAGGLAAQDEEYRLDLEDAERRLLAGELSAAESLLDEIVLAYDEEPEGSRPEEFVVHTARMLFAEVARRRGSYAEAIDDLAELPATFLATRRPTLLRARLLTAVGGYEEAQALLGEWVAAHGNDLEARYRLGDVLWRAGKRKAARKAWEANVAADRPEEALPLAFLGRSLWRLGGRKNLESASAVLVESLRLDPKRPEARTTFGILKFEAYGEARGFPSGEKDLDKVLQEHGDYEPALLAMYRLRVANGLLDRGRTEEYLSRALAQNPNSTEALVLRGSNILDDRRFAEAEKWFRKALAVNPRDQAALSHLASARWLLGDLDEYRTLRERALIGDPGQPEPDRIHADHLVRLYRFADAIPFYESALRGAPDDIPSLQGLARALIYTGDGAGARERLERAKALANGINDPWRNNALAAQKLLDSEYVAFESGGIRLLLHREDAEILSTYLMPIFLEAKEELGKRYGYVPDRTVTIEVFHTWDDFSVRTTGFYGFTALGACFGPMITMVSPGDGDVRRQDFMWEATAWHEYTHVLTLALSRHRVPRWLTEGFSVYEEKVRDRTWDRGMDRELFDAWHNDEIPPIHLLNRLFRGPRILFGYYQGGLVVDVIVRRYGFAKATALLAAFGEDLGVEAACRKALGITTRQLDAMLREHVEREHLRGMRLVPRYSERGIRRLQARASADRSDLEARLGLAWAFVQRDNPVDAGRWLAEVIRAEPDHAEAKLVRAAMLYRRGEKAAAIQSWRAGFAAGAEDFDSRIRCGDALMAAGDDEGAEDQWQRAKACWPNCTEQSSSPELRLARLYRGRGDRTRAQMEMKAFCRRTARAFAPRLVLAGFERDAGNRAEEVRYLEECNRIDPFHRAMHVQLGEAYEALDRPALAAREYEMAAAVLAKLDRRYLSAKTPAPDDDAPGEREERGALWVRAARLRRSLGDGEVADRLLRRTMREAPGTAAAAEAEGMLH